VDQARRGVFWCSLGGKPESQRLSVQTVGTAAELGLPPSTREESNIRVTENQSSIASNPSSHYWLRQASPPKYSRFIFAIFRKVTKTRESVINIRKRFQWFMIGSRIAFCGNQSRLKQGQRG